MKGQTNPYILTNKLQRKLRHAVTDAEKKLWRELRGKQFDGYKFRRQHPNENFILDFVCLEVRLIIEVDGGQHLESSQDQARDEMLRNAGFCVMRFWNNQVLNEMGSVVEAIWLELEKCDPSPPQLLPLKGRESDFSLLKEGVQAPPPSRGRLGGGWVVK